MTQAFEEARKYIDEIPKFVKKNTMEDTKAFYRKLSCPCEDTRVIHVAGTNGKGSVCAYLQSVLTEAGYRTGLFTSPHLVDIRERIRVDEEQIPEADFVEVFRRVRDACPKESGYHPSYFEYLYFMAMLYFEKKKPDFIILETGLGGRLDATNSFETPCISIIAEIGLDHTEYLGETLEQIAEEKAGIVKKGIPLVYFAKNKIVADVMEKSAKKADSKAFSVKPAEICLKNSGEKGIDFSYHSGYYKYSVFRLSTRALYQQENAALCIRALAVLEESGIVKVPEEDLRRGLEKTHWEGRMEEILPGVYVDGAHNPDGIEAFLQSVRADGAKDGRMLLYSSLEEKACGEMIRRIADAGLFEEIVVTKIDSPRAAMPSELARLFGETGTVVTEDTKEAFDYCLRRRRAEEKVYITGSLYLTGQIKALTEGKKEHDQF
ncbi:bifunctional folylpolyglutamate synthase/dihydrofolate synthase [bacterium 1XD8-76]|nr:bifunctional folylpolyglutamate synthase/dihydrofolate synthase [bacterium 1XD8-76]